MYINRSEAEVTLGRNGEFEATLDEWSSIQSQNTGFIGGTLLQSYANPGRYTLTSRWTDREAWVAADRREQFTSFARALLTSGLARPTRLVEAYESVFEIDHADATSSASSAERWIDFTLTEPMVAPAFEANVRKLAEISVQRAPGILSVRLRRSMGSDTKYLLLVITTDRAAARGWLLAPDVRAWMESNRLIQYLVGAPVADIAHVVKRYAGPARESFEVVAAAPART